MKAIFSRDLRPALQELNRARFKAKRANVHCRRAHGILAQGELSEESKTYGGTWAMLQMNCERALQNLDGLLRAKSLEE